MNRSLAALPKPNQSRGAGRWSRFVAFVRRNPGLAGGFVDHRGIFHPIRHAKNYNEKIVDARERQRELTGMDTIGQQTLAYVERSERSEERKAEEEARLEPYRRRIDQLTANRDLLREEIANEPAAKYTELVSAHGRARSESGLIPFGTARKYLPRRPESYTSAIVERDGKRYLRWEYALDEIGEDLGYDGAQGFRDAIEQIKRDRQTLRKTERQIREARAELRAEQNHRRNPGQADETGPNALTRFWRWLTR